MIKAHLNTDTALSIGSLASIVSRFAPSYQRRANASFNSTSPKQTLLAFPEPRKRLAKELKKSRLIGTTADGQRIYLFDYRVNSSVIRELGRLRELSFRAVGEGTNKLRDLDQYDKHYRHIILWNEVDQELVGSYRIGEAFALTQPQGNSTLASNSAKGSLSYSRLYTSELFRYKSGFDAIAPYSVELGRSFIQPKYWSRRGLDYLWQGVGAYLQAHPNVRYLFGAVSISNDYPELAKQEIVGFYKHFYQPANATDYAEADRPFVINRAVLEGYRGLAISQANAQLKSSLSKQNVTLPVLYKHYAELCEQSGVNFFDFNVDPNFANCVDGLIVADLSKIKDAKKHRYLRDLRNGT